MRIFFCAFCVSYESSIGRRVKDIRPTSSYKTGRETEFHHLNQSKSASALDPSSTSAFEEESAEWERLFSRLNRVSSVMRRRGFSWRTAGPSEPSRLPVTCLHFKSISTQCERKRAKGRMGLSRDSVKGRWMRLITQLYIGKEAWQFFSQLDISPTATEQNLFFFTVLQNDSQLMFHVSDW